MKRKKFKSKKAKIIIGVIIILVVIGAIAAVVVANKEEPAPVADTTSTEQPVQDDSTVADNPAETPANVPEATPPTQSTPPPTSQYPVLLTSSEAAALTVVVNKKHKLPSTYVPALSSNGRLRPEANTALNSLFSAASTEGINVKYISGYRSYAKQEQLYNGYVASDGQAAADTYSARPGYSEHQTGLAADVGSGTCDLETCFADTAAGKWIAANAHKYGFIIRYPKGKDAITGYQYEPWHLRYLGISEATAVYNSGKTLEEYYGIPGGGY